MWLTVYFYWKVQVWLLGNIHIAHTHIPLDRNQAHTAMDTGKCEQNLGLSLRVSKKLRTSSDGQPAASVLEKLEAVITVKTQDATYEESSREGG